MINVDKRKPALIFNRMKFWGFYGEFVNSNQNLERNPKFSVFNFNLDLRLIGFCEC